MGVVPASGFSFSAQQIWKVMVATVRCEEIANQKFKQLVHDEVCGHLSPLMRFALVFNYDSDSMPRVWTGNEDIRSITKDARTVSLKLLLTMAAIRLDEKPDNIENVLVSSLVDRTVTVSSSQNRKLGPPTDPLASSSWEEEAHKRSNNWLPPPWAIMAMIVLGFNEFMMLLKNPLYLMVLFVAFLLSKALWVQMDITGHSFTESSVSSNISSSDTGMEYSRQRRTANVEEVESS
ncbi:unnamed protein product [Malus baccata var. baccata]